MDDENFRVNLVINRYENPMLYAMLADNPVKARASLLRQAADFGVWARASGLKLSAADTPVNAAQSTQLAQFSEKTVSATTPIAAKPISTLSKSASQQRAQNTHSLQKKGKTVDVSQPIIQPQPAPVSPKTASTQVPVRAEMSEGSSADDVLDTSVLSNFDLGDLD